jgi:hypothetical protein
MRSSFGVREKFTSTLAGARFEFLQYGGEPSFVDAGPTVAPIAATRRDRKLKDGLHLRTIINIHPPAFTYVVARIVPAHQQ